MRVTRFIAAEEGSGTSAGHNICGVLVHTAPGLGAEAIEGLLALPGVEIHRVADDGRLVVTVEDTADTPASITLTRLSGIKGVASAALVYHHCETQDLAEEASS